MIPLIFVLFLMLGFVQDGWAAEQSFKFGKFDQVITYQETASPSKVVLFISGDGGWNLGVVEMAKALAKLNALVIGVDINHYLKNIQKGDSKCLYPASDLEMLSQYIQKEKGFPEFKTPLLVGYSSGATLVYAILAQSPANTFSGAISLGFCPDLLLSRPMCSGHGLQQERLPKGKGFNFLPRTNLERSWFVLHGDQDRVCPFMEAKKFTGAIPASTFILLPKVGHGFSIQKNWMPQFIQSFNKVLPPSTPKPATFQNNLPLIELELPQTQNKTLAVILSGDGGWANIDKEIGDQLNRDHFSVLGFNSLQYFWKRKTIEQATHDLELALHHYLRNWRKDKILLIGYSFGADVLPFIANQLDPSLKKKISKVVLLSPGKYAQFEISISNWLGGGSPQTVYSVGPEILKIQEFPVLCIFGKDDENSVCRSLKESPNKNIKVMELDGGHHFGGAYQILTKKLLEHD